MSLMTLRIGPRLGLSFGLMVLLMVGMAVAALLALKRTDDNLDTVVNDRYVKVRRVTGILDELNLQARNARNVLLFNDAATRSPELDSIRRSRQRATDHYEALIPTISDPQAKAALGRHCKTATPFTR